MGDIITILTANLLSDRVRRKCQQVTVTSMTTGNSDMTDKTGNSYTAGTTTNSAWTHVNTWMGDCLQAGTPSRYVTSHLGQLSLCGTVEWVSAFEPFIFINGDGVRSFLAVFRLQAGLWLKSVDLVQRLAATWRFMLHSSNEPGELSQCSKHDDSTINIVLLIIITSAEGGYVFTSVCLYVCLSVG